MAELDAIIQKHIADGTIHGGSFVAVDRNGNDIYRKAHGRLTVDPASGPLTLDSLTWIASQTKLVTSVAVMQVVEKGLIGLDDDLRDIVPALKELKVLKGFEGDDANSGEPAAFPSAPGAAASIETPKGKPIFEDVKNPITLRRLVSHSSGFCYDLASPLVMRWSAATGRTDNMFMGSIAGATHPLVYQPNEDWEYSPSLDWAGHVVAQLTGQDLNSYEQEHIWGPLGARSTTFHPATHFDPATNPMPSELETAHRDPTTGGLVAGPSPWPRDAAQAIGGAGLYSTPNDYSKLLVALLQGGGPLLSQASVDELLRPQMSEGSLVGLRRFVNLGMGRLWDLPVDPTGKGVGIIDPPAIKIDHCLAGTVNEKDVPGRRAAGTVNWGGLPCLNWWIDRKSGVTATFFTQLLPTGDPKMIRLNREVETTVYKLVRGA